MFVAIRLERTIAVIVAAAIAAVFLGFGGYFLFTDKYYAVAPASGDAKVSETEGKKHIKWVDMTVPLSVMNAAYELDVNSRGELDWVSLMAYLAAKCGGNFKGLGGGELAAAAERLKGGERIEDIAGGLKYFNYYAEAYRAIFAEYVGEYKMRIDGEWQDGYGLKAFSPLARGYGFSHSDDFGNGRSFGYKRKHLGHDLMGAVGTPVIAVESGVVEALGWNMYGGWRIGIRSFDKKRYYYYAHLRKDHPYREGLEEGATVTAGDVIGYLGMTGYSSKENVNNIVTPHLHFGIQLIFDESQKDGVNQIWIDAYNITLFLQKNRSAAERDGNDFKRATEMYDPSVPD